MNTSFNPAAEWLEADGLGGFASGTVSGIRTRRYHALLLAAARPPAERFVLVNGLEVRAETPAGSFPLSSQAYAPGVIDPDGRGRIAAFTHEPWPRWEFRLEDGTVIEQEILVPRGAPLALISWRLAEGRGKVLLTARPLISGRDFHALHQENPSFRFDAEKGDDGAIRWRPYEGVPGIAARGNGSYEHRPGWYRNFLYSEEQARGHDCVEDLASPGTFCYDLSEGEATLILAAEGTEAAEAAEAAARGFSPEKIRSAERRRRAAFPTPLHRAADAYRVRKDAGQTILAGYPWLGESGRDTFVALRGLCLATGQPEEAGEILARWASTVSQGMLPSRFPDRGGEPEYDSVDTSLWYLIAVHDYLQAMARAKKKVYPREFAPLPAAAQAILEGYAAGTRHGIRLDSDGLLATGAPGIPLTWMDARVGGAPVTPRIGKPVEVEALWLNALWIAAGWSTRWKDLLKQGLISFQEKFWNSEGGYLYDVVDADHVPGKNDATFRPNQIFAVGGLPWNLIAGERARRVVQAVEERLLTPAGLRSLAPGEPGYAPRCEGGAAERDAACHQGTVWPWLLGPFVEAWLRVREGTGKAKIEARSRFLKPLRAQTESAGLGHLFEIADAEAPHAPRGCPFQAWSVGEALRISSLLEEKTAHVRRAPSVAARPAAGAPIEPGAPLMMDAPEGGDGNKG